MVSGVETRTDLKMSHIDTPQNTMNIFVCRSTDSIYMFSEMRTILVLEILLPKVENIEISLRYVLSFESELVQANLSEWQLETCAKRG